MVVFTKNEKMYKGPFTKRSYTYHATMQNLQNELTEKFKNYLQNLGYSKSSCYMLPECVRDFLSYTKKEAEQITPKEIQRFYEHLQQRPHKKQGGGLSEAYINHHIFSIRIFFNWLESIGEIKYNPISVMKFKSPKGKIREPLTQAEIQTLFEVATSLKEIAILHLFYSCGLRRSEAESLNIKDVHLKSQILYVREGKGAKRRAIPMTMKVTTELESYYLEERIEGRARDMEAFMLNKRNARMRGDSYNKILKEIIGRTEITKEASLHHLRHSIATHLLESGLSVEYVRDFLGHAFLESTQIYTKVNQGQLNKMTNYE